MNEPVIRDEQFISMVNIIAQKHNCSIANIDLENRVISIDGSDEDAVLCAAELDDLLGRYAV